MQKKFTSDEDRHAARLESKRRWREKNRDRIKDYNQRYYLLNREKLSRDKGHNPREIPTAPDRDWLVEHGHWLVRDLESMSQALVAQKYNTNRRTLMRAVKDYQEKSDA